MRFTLIMIAVLLSGCASNFDKFSLPALAGNEPLHQRHKQLGPNTYYVEELGNGFSRHQTLELFFEKKAHELCPAGVRLAKSERGTRFPDSKLGDNVLQSCVSGGFCNATQASFPLVYGVVECFATSSDVPKSTREQTFDPSFQQAAFDGR